MSETRKIAAILVADVVGYSRLADADEERTLGEATRAAQNDGYGADSGPSRGDPARYPPNCDVRGRDLLCPLYVCAVTRRRFPVGASPTRQPLQPEATGAVMEVTKWLKPSV